MKTNIKIFLLVIAGIALFSFSPKKGGEGFEVYLNNKLVLQQFGNKMNDVRTIQLDQRSPGDEIRVKYHHCGQWGKDRVLEVKNDQNKTLKEWHYKDADAGDASMIFRVQDVLSLKKDKLNLYYSSKELPGGRLLVSIES